MRRQPRAKHEGNQYSVIGEVYRTYKERWKRNGIN